MPKEPWDAVDDLRGRNLGRLLHRAFRKYHDHALEAVRLRGYSDLTLALSLILPHIDRQGTRLTEIAERAGITKQSASEAISKLAALGYVERAPDAADRRSQRVSFTKKGERFLRDAYAAKLSVRRSIESTLGTTGTKQLERLLQKYLDE